MVHKRNRKYLVAMLSIFIMLFSMIPSSVFAEELTGSQDNVTGIVLAPEGEEGGIDGATVYFVPVGGNTSIFEEVDSSGAFSVDLFPGEWEVRARAAKDSPWSNSFIQVIKVEVGEPIQLSLTLTEPKLKGRVLTSEAQPFEDTLVYLRAGSYGAYLDYTFTDESGYFKLGGLEPGTYELGIDTYSGLTHVNKVITIPATEIMEIIMPTLNVMGMVLDPQDNLVDFPYYLHVKYMTTGQGQINYYNDSKYIQKGNFALALEDGIYYIDATPADTGSYASSFTTKVVVSGGEVVDPQGDLNLKLTVPMVTGKVTYADGSPVARNSVSFNYQNSQDPYENYFYNSKWTLTDANGNYTMGGLKDGDYSITVHLPNGIYQGIGKVQGLNYEGPQDLVVQKFALTGKVVDPSGHNPVPYVSVIITSVDSPDSSPIYVGTDNQGNYKAALPPGKYVVVANPSGNSEYASSDPIEVEIVDGVPITQDLRLNDSLLSGQVLDWGGSPVKQANITLYDSSGTYLTGTSSNENGNFRFNSILEEGKNYRVEATYPGSSIRTTKEFEVTGEKQTLTVTFDTAPNIIGTVYGPDGIETIENATIDYYRVMPNGYFSWLAMSSSSGKFVASLDDGEYYLIVKPSYSKPYGRSVAQKITVTNGTCDLGQLELNLTDPIIVGKVTDDLGKPITSGNVNFKYISDDPNSEKSTLNSSFAPIDAHGNYYIGGIEDGTYEVWAETWPEGKIRESVPVRITLSGSEVTGDTTLVVPSINVKGTVMLPDTSTGASYVDVAFYTLEPENNWNLVANTQTDQNGNYEIALPQGEYIVRAEITQYTSVNNYTNSIPEKFVTPSAEEIKTIDLKLTNPQIRGYVTDKNGYSVYDAKVIAFPIGVAPEDAWIYAYGTTDYYGEFKIGGLPPGSYNVQVFYNNAYFGGQDVELPRENGKYLSFVVAEPNVSGRVTGHENLEAIKIVISQQDGVGKWYERTKVTVDSEGNFATYLPPGDYQARAILYSGNNQLLRSLPYEFNVEAEGVVTGIELQIMSPQITGKFKYSDGTPASDPYVYVRKKGGEDLNYRQRFNQDGSFQLSGLEAGEYQLEFLSQYATPFILPVEVEQDYTANRESIEYTYGEVNLTGLVLDPEGTSMKRFEISVSNLNDKDNWYHWGTVQNSEEGEYKLILPDGVYLIHAYGYENDFYPSDSIRVRVTDGVASADNGDTTLRLKKKPLVQLYSPWKVTKTESVSYIGSDDISTNLATISENWDNSERAVIAPLNGVPEYPAALFLAGHWNAPLFLVGSEMTTEQVELMKKLGVKNVTLIGGNYLLPQEMENLLKSELGTAATVNRVVGSDRYDVMVEASKIVFSDQDKPSTLILAPGNDSLQSTLALAGYAGKNNIGLMTIHGTDIFQVVLDEIERLNPTKILVLKGYGDQANQSIVDQVHSVLTDVAEIEWEWISGQEEVSVEMVNMESVSKLSRLGYLFNREQVLIAPLSSQATAIAANLGAKLDTIPLLTQNRVSMEILNYLVSGGGSTQPDMKAPLKIAFVGGIAGVLKEVYSSVGISVIMGDPGYEVRGWVLSPNDTQVMINGVSPMVDEMGNFRMYVNLKPGFNEITLTATKGEETQTETRQVFYQANNSQAIPSVNIGLSESGEAGIFVGIKEILNHLGRPLSAKIAGYKLEIYYDKERIKLHAPENLAQIGQFTVNFEEAMGKAMISDIGSTGITDFEELLFIPITLPGNVHDLAFLDLVFSEIILDDPNLSEVKISNPILLTFQKGKTFNTSSWTPGFPPPPTTSVPSIRDGIAGLQYLAGIRGAGIEASQVNLVNMASIRELDQLTEPVEPDMANVIALMQYLAGMRDNYLNKFEQ